MRRSRLPSEHWGRIDVLVNNAGIAEEKPFLEIEDESWDRILATNLRGAFLMAQRVARVQAAAGSGSIVHIASIDASGGDGPYASYNASKAGLLGLNRTMALELGPHGVRVNCVSPGFTHTEMTEVGVPAGMMEYLVAPLRPGPPAPSRATRGDRVSVRVPGLRRGLGDHGHRPHRRLRSDRELVHPRVDPGARWLAAASARGRWPDGERRARERRVRVVVLPDKGAEIHQITDLRSGTDVLFTGPWGLRPPGAPPLPGSGEDEFMWNYAGGWQELFPSVNEACVYEGNRIPFHGEVASLPWETEILDGDGGEACGPISSTVSTDPVSSSSACSGCARASRSFRSRER